MPKDLQLKASLARWFSSQNRYSNLREMAGALDIPFNTLRGYFSGKRASGDNLRRLTEMTGLELSAVAQSPLDSVNKSQSPENQFNPTQEYLGKLLEDLQFDIARCLSAIPPVQDACAKQPRLNKQSLRRKARLVSALMDAVERSLSPFLNNPEALRILRESTSGHDAGYLSGLLGSIWDDRRLRAWQQLTTYKYGSK